MPNEPSMTDHKVATGTWSIPGPINSFSYATYKRDGKTFTLPVGVAGERITGQFPETAPSQS